MNNLYDLKYIGKLYYINLNSEDTNRIYDDKDGLVFTTFGLYESQLPDPSDPTSISPSNGV